MVKTCLQLTAAPSAFNITLQQRADKKFRVTYGMQVEDNLTYVQAAAKLGQAIMHALACDSLLDNEGP